MMICLLLLIFPSLLLTQTFYVYTLSMGEPNQLLVYGSNSSNYLTYLTSVSTGGNGVPLDGPGVQSQSSITIYSTYLFACNPENSSISLFSLADPTNPTLIGSSWSGGDWPNSVTANANYACVVNSGVNNGIGCLMYSSAGFNESSRSWFGFGLNLTTPPVSHTGPAEISFTPDNMAVVVSNKGANPPLFYVPMASGVLGTTSVNSTIFGNVPFGFTWDPTDGSIILTDAAPFVVSGGGVQVIQVNSSMITELLPNFSFWNRMLLAGFLEVL